MKLTMVGTGYVGLVTGVCFAETGNDVTCLDVDEGKIEKLKQNICPIYEPGLTEMMERNYKAGRLTYSTDPKTAYTDAEMIFICVGTPSDEKGHTNLQYINSAADDIADAIKQLGPDQKPKVVVVKSTVPVGTTFHVRDRIRERVGPDIPFSVADNPEFLKEGDAIVDFMKPDRVVVGIEDERTGEMFKDLYDPFVRNGHPIFLMDVPSAEMVKYSANNFLATKISFINEMANLCEAYGADINRVREGMCSDSRVGHHFLYPGLGYGGSCFPKDTLACIMMGDKAGVTTQVSKRCPRHQPAPTQPLLQEDPQALRRRDGPQRQDLRVLGSGIQATHRRHPRSASADARPQVARLRRDLQGLRPGRHGERRHGDGRHHQPARRHLRDRQGRRRADHLD